MHKLICSFLAITSFLYSNPSQPQVVHGQVSFDTLLSNELIIHASDKAIIHWEEFSIDVNEITKFLQPGSQASVLNRVTGDQMSRLLGTLSANGQVYLINPQGVFIGPNGVIDTAGFTASALNLSDEDFFKGEHLVFQGESKASVTNYGLISASDGDALLIGYQVINEGTILAPNGVGGLAAGLEVLVQPLSAEHVYIRTATADQSEVGIDHQGTIEAVQAEIRADGNLYSLAIRCDGKVNARGIEEHEGRVFLVADQGTIEFQGEITSLNAENTGGTVHIFGDKIHLQDDALIDVSGKFGGGVALIGGNYQGKETPGLNANLTYVEKNAQVHADALQSGNGGLVVFWSDKDIVYFGSASAKGGEERGDGGLVEVSSKGRYVFDGLANTLAPKGRVGMLLMDPIDITISAAADSTNVMNPAGAGNYTFNGMCMPTPSNISTTVGTHTIADNLNSGDVTINTNATGATTCTDMGNITISDPITWVNHTLTLEADGSIVVNAALTSTGAAGLMITGNITNIGSIGEVQINAPINLFAGPISLSAMAGDVETLAPISTGKGDITILASAVLIQNMVITADGSIDITSFGGTIAVEGLHNDTEVFSPQDTSKPNNRATITLTGKQSVGLFGTGGFHAQVGCNTDNVLFMLNTLDPNADITINTPFFLQLLGGTAGSYAQIGHRGPTQPGSTVVFMIGKITINGNGTTPYSIQMHGGTGAGAYVQIGHSPSTLISLNIEGEIDIESMAPSTSSFDFDLEGGKAPDTYALIGFGSSLTSTSVNYTAVFPATTIPITIKNIHSMKIQGGSATNSFAGIGFAGRGTGILPIAFKNPAVFMMSSADQAVGPWTLTAGSGSTADAFIGFDYSNAFNTISSLGELHSITINTGEGIDMTLNGATTGVAIAFVGTGIGVTGGGLVEIATNIDLNVGQLLSPGVLTLNAFGGAAAIRDTPFGTIPFNTNSTVFAATDISINASSTNGAGIFGGHNLTVTAGRTITLTTPLGGLASIDGANSLNVVVDALFPTSPGIGLGGFKLNANSQLNSNNPIGVWTARFSQNTIQGTMNGHSFSGAPLVIDPQNQYGFYYSAGMISSPYTIFYKETGHANASPAFQKVVVFEIKILDINYDLDLEEIYWEPGFSMDYDRDSIKTFYANSTWKEFNWIDEFFNFTGISSIQRLHRKDARLSSYEVEQDDQFFENRKKYLYYKGYIP